MGLDDITGIVADIIGSDWFWWSIVGAALVFVILKKSGWWDKHQISEKLQWMWDGDGVSPVPAGGGKPQKGGTLVVDPRVTPVKYERPEPCVNCGYNTDFFICPRCDNERDTVNVNVRETLRSESRVENHANAPWSQPQDEKPQFHQSGCDCQCHNPEKGIVFCYGCSINPRCQG